MNVLNISGWKTTTAGICAIVIGLVGIVLHFVNPESVHAMDMNAGTELILGGLAVIGIGHKLERVAVVSDKSIGK